MKPLIFLSEIIFAGLALIYLFFQKILIHIICIYRDSKSPFKNDPDFLEINNVTVTKNYVTISGYKHLVSQCGNKNAEEKNTIIMMGGIPSNPSESLYWMAAELCSKDSNLLIYIVHLPFYESYSKINLDKDQTYAKHDANVLPFNRKIDMRKVRVDSKFSHANQAVSTYKIIKKLGINKANFVGHDRGVVVFENLLLNHPEIFISFSRGAQIWDYFESEWLALAPKICVGPPHGFFIAPFQLKFLFSIITFFKLPFGITEIQQNLKNAIKGSEAYDRITHLIFKANNPSKDFLLKFRQTMLQTNSLTEVKNRAYLKKVDIKIMQFQGEDEFKYGKNGKLISDQPYFGIYNLFKNEVEDLYPGCIGQEKVKKRENLLEEKKHYKKLKLLPNSKMHTFALIPKSAHFNVIENPKGCANAVYDFIKS